MQCRVQYWTVGVWKEMGGQLNKYDDRNRLKQINPYTAGIGSFLFRIERIYK